MPRTAQYISDPARFYANAQNGFHPSASFDDNESVLDPVRIIADDEPENRYWSLAELLPYIQSHGTHPLTGRPLSVNDLDPILTPFMRRDDYAHTLYTLSCAGWRHQDMRHLPPRPAESRFPERVRAEDLSHVAHQIDRGLVDRWGDNPRRPLEATGARNRCDACERRARNTSAARNGIPCPGSSAAKTT